MGEHRKRSILRGTVAGIAGGLIASWAMNEFMAGPGRKIQQSLSDGNSGQKPDNVEDDATMKAADSIVDITTGGRHLSQEGKKKAGPIVHYGYGALMGGIYGGLVEYWNAPKAGFGALFGTVLFGAGDLAAVPALHLGASPTEQPPSALVNPFLGHVVYGTAAELSRRAIRPLL
ncbi:MAG TPA: DUF1440 domain-containing protein [Acidobacteriaceae bacterium]|nr:DUF1440 domain-containing protein [Acidobacteriaceae bacterium]